MRRLLTALSLSFSVSSWAAEKSVEAVGANRTPINSGTLYEAVGGLVIVVALIVALGWGLRKMQRLPLAGKGAVNVIGGVSLGPRERAVLLQVGDTQLLVGVAPGRVQTLHVLDQQIETNAAEAGERQSGFQRKLSQALKREEQK